MRITRTADRVGIIALVIGAGALTACGPNGSNTTDSAMGTVSDSAAAATGASATASEPAMTDANISSQVGTINGAEIQAAEVATRRARSADVKRFARDMITDHRAMQKMVDSIATAKNLTPEPMANADSLQTATKAEQDRLSQLTGAAFDSAYANSQVMAHQQALDFLNRASNATQDSDLRNVIQQAIPKVQAHLDRARTLVGGRSDSAATKQ